MKRKTIKVLSMLIAVTLLLVSFAGCSQKQDTTKGNTAQPTGQATKEVAKNSWETDKSPVTLKLFYDNIGTTVNYQKFWGKDPVSKKWIEDTGVNIEFIYPPDNEHSKLNVMIASGDLTDMIYTNDTLQQVRDLAKHDQIWAMNKLAEKAAPNFMKNNIDNHVLLEKRVVWDSMDLFIAPFYFTRAKSMNSQYVTKNITGVAAIDKIYEAVGKPQIKTTDDFLNMLRQVKQKFPDVIPLQGNRNSSKDSDGNPRLISKSLGIGGLSGRFYKEGDKYFKYWEHPNFLKLLKFYNTVYNEGLMDKTEFTDKPEQLQAKEFSGRVFTDISQDVDNLDWFNGELHKAKPDWSFIMIDAPGIDSNTKYASDSFNAGKPSADGIVIPKKGKYAERALQWLDYIYSDQAQRNIMFGIEGQSYAVKDGIPMLNQEVQDLFTKSQDDAKMKYGNDAYWGFRINDYAAMKRQTSCSELQKSGYPVVAKFYQDYSFFSGAESYKPNSEELKIAVNIKEYYSVEIMKVLLAKPDQVEPMYKNMIAKMKELGLDKLTAYWTNYYNNKESIIKKYSADLK